MNNEEWTLCVRAAEAWSRKHGPRTTGHVVSTSAFIRDAALACARVLLLDNLDKPKNHISTLEGDGELNADMVGLVDE
jgi:hypothetical protein